MFSDDEATAVVLGLLAARRLGLPSEATESTLAKVLRVLPTALRGPVQALEQTLGFTLAARGSAAPDTAILLTLAAAAREQRRVRLAYRSWNGTESERDFDTYGLVFHSGRWYATGHDHQSGERRTFRVDRMAGAEPRPEQYEIPEDADPVGQVTHGLSAVPYAHEIEVLLETGLAEARGRIPPTVATLTETEGGVLLRNRAERLDGMAHMLAGLGWPFVIQHPEGLRETVRTYADLLAAQGARRGSSSLM
jgi:predicted DNA-binding transcriptional regulator YafY